MHYVDWHSYLYKTCEWDLRLNENNKCLYLFYVRWNSIICERAFLCTWSKHPPAMWGEHGMSRFIFRVLHRVRFLDWNHIISGKYSTDLDLSSSKSAAPVVGSNKGNWFLALNKDLELKIYLHKSKRQCSFKIQQWRKRQVCSIYFLVHIDSCGKRSCKMFPVLLGN